MSIALTGHSDPFHLSSHLNGIYNARTTADGGITATNTQAPITQAHEREIAGLAYAFGITGESNPTSGVTEVTVPIYLAYDDVKSAVAAASGLKSGKGGLGEVAIAFERPGTVKCAWLGNRKRQYYHFDGTNNQGTTQQPVSLQQIYDRMSDHMYSKGDGLFSTLHSVPSVHYTTHDVKEVECTKIKIPRSVRPIVCPSPCPPKAANGSTVYPPDKYIVVFGFATMRCTSAESKDVDFYGDPKVMADGGWAFWLKVCVEVVVYAVEIAAALGQSTPLDATPAVWTVSSNLVEGQPSGSLPSLNSLRLNALRSLEKRGLKRLQTVNSSAKKKTKRA